MDALHLDTLEVERIAEAPEGVYERLFGIVHRKEGLVVTVGESETEPPQFNVGNRERRRPLAVLEASPIAVVLEGYALLLNPTVPIIGEGQDGERRLRPIARSHHEAAVDHLVDAGSRIGIARPSRAQ